MPTPDILVTGAGGFIGSHLVEELLRQGKAVRAFVHYNALQTHGWLDILPPDLRANLDIVAGDIRDAHVVREAVRGCGTVFHLAALISIPYSYAAPESYIDTNIKGTLNILQAARELGVAKLVHTSTSEVYGTARFVPITEDHPLVGQSPYSASKIGADQMAVAFQRSFGTPVAIIRPFNVYGPRQSTRAVIPTIITQALFGSGRIRLGTLSSTRDFTFVRDTVAGFLAIAESPATVGTVLNVGSNFEVSIADIAQIIAEECGRDLEIEQDAQRLRPAESEVERLWADNQRMLGLTGWQPSYGGVDGFRRGIRETMEWFTTRQTVAQGRIGEYQV